MRLSAKSVPPFGGVVVMIVGGCVCVAASAQDSQSAGPMAAHRIRRITLEQVKQSAGSPAVNPFAARMAQLAVEAAKQHRLAVRADYFPKFGALAGNLHYTESLGTLVTIRRPLLGIATQVAVPIFSQNQTFAVLTFTQPLTPLLQVHEAVKIARADERIAQAKAAAAISRTAREAEMEATYFQLLIAQRKLLATRSKQMVGGRKADDNAAVEVDTLTATLNRALGWPEDTELELAMPAPLVENISLEGSAISRLMRIPTWWWRSRPSSRRGPHPLSRSSPMSLPSPRSAVISFRI